MSLDINWRCVRFCKDNSNFCTSRDSHTTVKFVLHEMVRKENEGNVQNLSCIIFVSTFCSLWTFL